MVPLRPRNYLIRCNILATWCASAIRLPAPPRLRISGAIIGGMRMAWIRTSIAAVFLLQGVGVGAQGGDAAMAALARCRTITAADARLSCFDEAAARIDEAVKAKELTIVDKRDVQKARRSLFGFSLPRIPLFGIGGDRPPEGLARAWIAGDRGDAKGGDDVAQLDTVLIGATPLANGRFELRLLDGAVWQTTDPLAFPPRPNTKVRIRRGALGNFFIAFQGERIVRGIRLR